MRSYNNRDHIIICKGEMPDLPAMQGMTGSSTGMRYLWMNTLIVDQKPWERMTFGRMPLVKAREWPNFLQS